MRLVLVSFLCQFLSLINASEGEILQNNRSLQRGDNGLIIRSTSSSKRAKASTNQIVLEERDDSVEITTTSDMTPHGIKNTYVIDKLNIAHVGKYCHQFTNIQYCVGDRIPVNGKQKLVNGIFPDGSAAIQDMLATKFDDGFYYHFDIVSPEDILKSTELIVQDGNRDEVITPALNEETTRSSDTYKVLVH